MEDTDSDFLFEGLSSEETKRMRRILVQWCNGDENSFPVQLALLTRAQWRAAAQTPVLLTQSLELLDRKLGDYRQHTAKVVKDFNVTVDTKVAALEDVISRQQEAADAILADLRGHTAIAKDLLGEIEHELTKGTEELKRFRNEFISERNRLEEARVRWEQQESRWDWIIFVLLLLAMIAIGVLLGWRFPR